MIVGITKVAMKRQWGAGRQQGDAGLENQSYPGEEEAWRVWGRQGRRGRGRERRWKGKQRVRGSGRSAWDGQWREGGEGWQEDRKVRGKGQVYSSVNRP